MGKEIKTVVKKFGGARTLDGIHTAINARCIPSSSRAVEISSTDSSLACRPGEGLEVSMFKPNDSNPNHYHYVATLVKTDNKVMELYDAVPTLQQKRRSSQADGEILLRFRPAHGLSGPSS